MQFVIFYTILVVKMVRFTRGRFLTKSVLLLACQPFDADATTPVNMYSLLLVVRCAYAKGVPWGRGRGFPHVRERCKLHPARLCGRTDALLQRLRAAWPTIGLPAGTPAVGTKLTPAPVLLAHLVDFRHKRLQHFRYLCFPALCFL